MDITQAKEFHPLFKDVANLGFPIYLKQNFMNDTCALELIFKTKNGNYSAEYGGHFPSLDSFVPNYSKTAEPVDLKTFSLHLGYIGVLKEEHRQKKLGTQLLMKLTELVDKYNIRMDLKIDERFGMSYRTLKRWYEKFDFIYLGDRKMMRFSKSERDTSPFIKGEPWKGLLEYVASLYEISSLDKGYSVENRNFYATAFKQLTTYKENQLWSIPDLYFIDRVVEISTMLIAAMDQDGDHPDQESFEAWANDILF